jgi:excisionase family DNA binding protein
VEILHEWRDEIEAGVDRDEPKNQLTRLAGYSVRELAEYLGRSPSTIRDWLRRGEFPGAYKLGREWRIPKADVEAFLERQKEGRKRERRRGKSQPVTIGEWRKQKRSR